MTKDSRMKARAHSISQAVRLGLEQLTNYRYRKFVY